MKYSIFTLIVLLPLIFACNRSNKKQDNNVFKSGIIEDEPQNQDDWELVWSDEFNYTGLPDTTKWSYDVGGHGWGNNEKQYYTETDPDNAKVIDGVLEITARQEKK
ncbi:MAG TPA: hypothetical protein VJ919_13815, partial [Tangfeifania sp.]|nr:hypothetical protein [Tangfeifania sp.]